MRWSKIVTAGLTCLTAVLSDASNAAVDIRVNLAAQTMHVVAGDGQTYDWTVSTARRGYVTPTGTYGVQSLQRTHFSRRYHNSPMPYSIFFHGGYAIHGTYATGSLGRTASHGCIRLSPDHAATLFRMVKREGARIAITSGASGPDRLTLREGRLRASHVAARRRVPDEPLAYAPTPTSDYDRWIMDPSAN